MATILKAGKGRCDSTCHQATSFACACICGGRYHGTGSSVASLDKLATDARAGDLGENVKRIIDRLFLDAKGLAKLRCLRIDAPLPPTVDRS